MLKRKFEPGNRVRLKKDCPEGLLKNSDPTRTRLGTAGNYSKHYDYRHCLQILWDGNKHPDRMSESYLEKVYDKSR